MLTFHSDSAFQIGHDHISANRPCQDYATSISTPSPPLLSLSSPSPYAIACISDGCSTAGHTDVGARIVALATQRALQRTTSAYLITGTRDAIIDTVRCTLGLEQRDLYATSLYLHATLSGVRGLIQGDGGYGVRFSDGTISSFRFEWLPALIDGVERSVPFYPTYDVREREKFKSIHMQQPGPRFEVARSPESFSLLRSVNAGMRGYEIDLSLKNVVAVAVFSDGVSQVDNWSWQEVVEELMLVPNYNGEFAKRKLAFAIRKFKTRGKGPLDDISMAAIHIDGQVDERPVNDPELHELADVWHKEKEKVLV